MSYQYSNLSEDADRVGGQLRGDKECPFSGVTKPGRVWRKVPESDARSVALTLLNEHSFFCCQARVEQHGMPPGLQRADGRCGNVDFLKRGGFQNAVFRALCDAEGPTPCCYNGTCVNRTQDQCVCADCLDMRSRIEAEHATWLPAQAQCRRRKLSVAEMCRLLANSTIVFKGASLVRHLYTGFLLTVTGNDIAGAQAKNIPKGKRERESVCDVCV